MFVFPMGMLKRAKGLWGWRLGLVLALCGWALARGAQEPAAERTVLVLGDSIAAGSGVDMEQAFPALLGRKVEARGLPFRVVNGGLSGDTTAGGLRRINWLLRQRVDVLVLELGGNDGLRGLAPAATKTNLLGIVERVRERYPECRLVVAGMRMPANMGEEYTREFEAVFPAVAEEVGARLVPFLLEGVGGVAELNQPDRIHPTPEGHALVAETVWKVLGPLLEEMAGGKPDPKKSPVKN